MATARVWSMRIVPLVVLAGLLCFSCRTTKQPRAAAVGYLTAGQQQFEMTLAGHGGKVLQIKGAGKPVQAPADTYALADCVVEAQGAQGARWRATGMGDPARRFVEVKAGQTTPLTFGPPFVANLGAQKASGAVAFSFRMTGQAGEVYSPANVQRNGARVDPPKILIKDAQGKVVAEDAFRYG